MDDDEVRLLQQKIIEIRQSWYKRNEEEVLKRLDFEEAVSFCVAVRFLYQSAYLGINLVRNINTKLFEGMNMYRSKIFKLFC